MTTNGIVILKATSEFESKLDQALVGLKEVTVLPISAAPVSDGGMTSERQQIVLLAPKAIFVEVQNGYDYSSLLTTLRQDLSSSLPSFIGVLDGAPDAELVAALPMIPVDSFVFSDNSLDNILAKVDAVKRLQVQNDQLLNDMQFSNETAMTAMKAASEIGLLMQMIDWLQSAATEKDVTDCLFRICQSFQLNGYSLVLNTESSAFYPESSVPDNVKRILLQAIERDMRVFSKEKILIFKLDHMVLMITNAPWENQEQYGRFRDVLLQACVLAEAKIRTLAANKLINDQHEQVSDIMMLIKMASSDTQKYAKGIMEKLSNDLSLAAVSLDLTEEQESALAKLSDQAYSAIDFLYKNSDALEVHFHRVIESFSKIKELTMPDVPEQEENAFDDELF
ncbi:MAG: hypothetical protein H7A01_08005 [Hahellaceae bacterium]|nr:hypothetical protein [Hahellaceae bacterium]MCP5211589.1 hypothetical protein [Hahellaceae bacterium]